MRPVKGEKYSRLGEKNADRRRRPGPSYKPGDEVLLETHTLSNANKKISSKLASRCDGPYFIAERDDPCSYMIARNDAGTSCHSSAIRLF